MNKAVFFDRDGVINHDPGDYTYLLEEFTINDGIIPSLKKLYDNGFQLFIITNQGGIGKGIYTQQHVEAIHKYLIEKLRESDIELTEIYYCPHHSDVEKCLCRKPGSLLIEKAIARFNIDRAHSLMIGDNAKDVEVAKNAGIKGIQIAKNSNLLAVANQLDNGGEV